MTFLLSAGNPAAIPARQAAFSTVSTAIIQTSGECVRMEGWLCPAFYSNYFDPAKHLAG